MKPQKLKAASIHYCVPLEKPPFGFCRTDFSFCPEWQFLDENKISLIGLLHFDRELIQSEEPICGHMFEHSPALVGIGKSWVAINA